jgi:hypothetical protein
MNNDEAKFILQGYRPNGTDAGDEAFRPALDQVRVDPALRDWFARQQSFDAAVSAKLNAVTPPAGLREAILAGARVSGATTQTKRWWQQPAVYAVAASVAVIFALAAAFWPERGFAATGLADYVMADTALEQNHMGGHGADAVVAMLSDPSRRLGAGLPISFDALRAAGCRTVTYQGREVLEICFNRNGVWFHAYIGRRTDFPAVASAPRFEEKGDLSVASWADQTHVYLVAGKAGRAALERLL